MRPSLRNSQQSAVLTVLLIAAVGAGIGAAVLFLFGQACGSVGFAI
jgi:hypothetical protein